MKSFELSEEMSSCEESTTTISNGPENHIGLFI